MMKGFFNILLMFGLILLFTLALVYLISSLSEKNSTVLEVSLNNVVYMLRDSLDVAKVFVEGSVRNSLVQAMYDNAFSGGFQPDTKIEHKYVHDGTEYTAWFLDVDVSPEMDTLESNLESETYKNFKVYVESGIVNAIFPVDIPQYPSVDLNNRNNFTIDAVMFGDNDFSIKRILSNGNEIVVEKSSDVFISVNIPYFMIMQDAKNYSDELVGKLGDCNEDVINVVKENFYSIISSHVLESSSKCIVKVVAQTKKEYVVWDGSDVVYSPIKLVFVDVRTRDAVQPQEEQSEVEDSSDGQE